MFTLRAAGALSFDRCITHTYRKASHPLVLSSSTAESFDHLVGKCRIESVHRVCKYLPIVSNSVRDAARVSLICLHSMHTARRMQSLGQYALQSMEDLKNAVSHTPSTANTNQPSRGPSECSTVIGKRRVHALISNALV